MAKYIHIIRHNYFENGTYGELWIRYISIDTTKVKAFFLPDMCLSKFLKMYYFYIFKNMKL